jgi:hypothetical protein
MKAFLESIKPSTIALTLSATIVVMAFVVDLNEYKLIAFPLGLGFVGVHLICRSIEGLKDRKE